MNLTDNHKMVLVIALSLSFVTNSIIHVWSRNQRPADDVVKIEASRIIPNKYEEAKKCKDDGGEGVYNFDGKYLSCKFK